MLLSIRYTSTKAARYVPTSGVYPKGFKVGGIHCGVKKDGKSPDLAMLVNTHGSANAAAVFTKNKFKAAPVQVSKKILDLTNGHNINSLIVNSGNANAVTGSKGMEDAQQMVDATDMAVKGISASSSSSSSNPSTLVMSTGVIGNLLPMEKILSGIPKLAETSLGDGHDHWLECARAICTTDTFPKLVSKKIEVDGVEYTIAGLAKGAGMICPNMATLLGFFATDAPISNDALKSILDHSIEKSFNSISVDGDMSTNDTIIAIANGAAGGSEIDLSAASKDKFEKIQHEITQFAQQLAQLVVRDGEGATKFITIHVKDALSYSDAKIIARTIANSSLVKTAMYGKDANWGRILCSIGYSEVESPELLVIPSKTTVSFIPADGSEKLDLLVNGEPQQVNEERASEILQFEDLNIEINLGTGGNKECEFWTCDLTHEYITINGDYRS